MVGLSRKQQDLKDFLNEKADFYEQDRFIATDPIQVPHRFTKKEDIEIAAFLTATIAWGNRKSIIANGNKMIQFMDDDPHYFILNHTEKDLEPMEGFVHRTFNADDLRTFIRSLKSIYLDHGGLEEAFAKHAEPGSLQLSIHHFKKTFFDLPHQSRTQKHVSDPLKKSAAKRINMFLRWMVRSHARHVDFGIWQSLSPSQLSIPLDIHSGRIARELKMLSRKQNDGPAVALLDERLRLFDPIDPVKYDFALFGLSAFEKGF